MPKDQVKQAEAKLQRFGNFKADFDRSLANVLEALQVVRLKIGRHIVAASDGSSQGKSDGVLTHKAEEYLRCLDLSHRKLEDLLIADQEHWMDNLESSKVKAQQMAKHMKSLLDRQMNELSEYLDTGRIRPKFDLVRLPLWGEQVDDSEINFEWPKHKDLDLMSPDVSLQHLQFKAAVD